MNQISQLEEDIKNLKVRGATNIALRVIDSLYLAEKEIRENKNLEPHVYMLEQLIRLAFTRPTEPLAQNAVRFIFHKNEKSMDNYLKKGEEYKKLIRESKTKIADKGQELIQDGKTYLTHCHSTSVTHTLINAHKSGKKFSVVATETRPNFQGRLTAKELLEGGLQDITMVIDDVAPFLILGNKVIIDAVFVGADLLSENGFANKVGTLGLSFISNEKNIPVYCMTSLLKYDPRPYSDNLLESRPSEEIWDKAPVNLKFLSPAFDFVPYYKNISFITEAGIIKGGEIKSKALSLYPFLNSDINTTFINK